MRVPNISEISAPPGEQTRRRRFALFFGAGVGLLIACILSVVMLNGGGSKGGLSAQLSGDAQTQPTDPSTRDEFTRLVRAGEQLAKAGDLNGAMNHYDRALAIGSPTRLAESALRTYRAGALWRLGRREDAMGEHDRAVALDPNPFAGWARGETLRKLGRLSEALEAYELTLRVAPESASAHTGRGETLARMGKPEQARAAFDRAVEIDADAYNLTSRGLFLAERGLLEEAIVDFSGVIARDASQIPARLNRANAYAQLGRLEKALEDYAAAARLRPDNASVYRGRGWVYERQGLIAQARADYERALQLTPGDPWLKDAVAGLGRTTR